MLVGGGTVYRDKVKDLIKEKNMETYISVEVPEYNVPHAMAQADLFVFPSTFEGFGIVLIEAQALGLKCLASDIVTHEANCGGVDYLPLENGAEYWAEQIDRELGTDNSRQEPYDVSEFSVDNMSNRVYKRYTGNKQSSQ